LSFVDARGGATAQEAPGRLAEASRHYRARAAEADALLPAPAHGGGREGGHRRGLQHPEQRGGGWLQVRREGDAASWAVGVGGRIVFKIN